MSTLDYNQDVYFPTDVMCTGVWEALKGLSAWLLPCNLLCLLVEPAALLPYIFLRWKCWAEAHDEVAVFPLREIDFALYLQHLGETIGSKSTVEEAVNSIGWLSSCLRITVCTDSARGTAVEVGKV